MRIRWKDRKEDDFWLDVLRKMTREVQEIALQEGCTTVDAPVYYNLALEGTPVEDIYRENLQQLRELRKAVDPERVMDKTGGFRL